MLRLISDYESTCAFILILAVSEAVSTEGLVEYVGNAAGLMSLGVREDLERFKTFIENRSRVTKGW